MTSDDWGQSEHYTVASEWETVWLEGLGVPEGLVIGYFYGNLQDVAIDPDEQWCVMVGNGVVVYRLGPPWLPYEGRPVEPDVGHGRVFVEQEAAQWWEHRRGGHHHGRGPEPETLWLNQVKHAEGERFEAAFVDEEPADQEGPTRWAVLAAQRVVRPLNWLPDIP